MPTFARAWLFTCAHERPTLAAQLADFRRDLHRSERQRARLTGQLDHYIGQAIRARAERDRAERDRDGAQVCLVQAMAEQQEAVARISFLEDELRTAARIEDNLVATADGLRDELREVRAGLSVGALRKGRR